MDGVLILANVKGQDELDSAKKALQAAKSKLVLALRKRDGAVTPDKYLETEVSNANTDVSICRDKVEEFERKRCEEQFN